jgi:hypothetical protein
METVTTIRFRQHGEPIENVPVLNPGGWFGRAWVIEIAQGYWPSFFVVEADSETDAIDEFSGSRFGHLIKIEPEAFGDYGMDLAAGDYAFGREITAPGTYNLRGELTDDSLGEPYWNDGGEPCDLDNLGIYDCQQVAIEPYFIDEDSGELQPIVSRR